MPFPCDDLLYVLLSAAPQLCRPFLSHGELLPSVVFFFVPPPPLLLPSSELQKG